MQFLVNEPQACRPHRRRLPKGQGHTIALDLALVRSLEARENSDQCGFSRPVFTHQSMHLAPLQGEVHTIERAHSTETARQPLHAKGSSAQPVIHAGVSQQTRITARWQW